MHHRNAYKPRFGRPKEPWIWDMEDRGTRWIARDRDRASGGVLVAVGRGGTLAHR